MNLLYISSSHYARDSLATLLFTAFMDQVRVRDRLPYELDTNSHFIRLIANVRGPHGLT